MLRRTREPVSPLEVDKELAVDGRQVTPMQKMLSDQKSEFMSRLKSSFMRKKKAVVKIPLSFG